ncbi:MAG: glycosyltransferase family 4 protein [Planctomycetota bacterium]
MHILFVLDAWGLVGGTERHAAVVIPALQERGHRVSVLCTEDRHPDLGSVGVIEVPALGRGWLAREERGELSRRVKEARPDVILVSILHNADAYRVLLESAPLVRFVHDHRLYCPGMNKVLESGDVCRRPMGGECLERYWRHGGCIGFKPAMHRDRIGEPMRAVLAQQRELELVQRSTHVLTNSHFMRGELLQVGFHPDRTSVLPLFTLSNTAAQPPAPLDPATAAFVAAADPLLFTPARLTLPDKGVDFLLTALAHVRAPFRAVVSGEGPHRAWLEAKRHEDRVADRVHFSGWVAAGAIETLYARSAVVICPSVWSEPFGLVGLEAGAHEKPVVAFDVGGIAEWLSDGVNGFLVPRKDTRAMAAAVDRLLADPALAARLGANGRRLAAERFPPERHVERLEEVLRRAAGGAAPLR